MLKIHPKKKKNIAAYVKKVDLCFGGRKTKNPNLSFNQAQVVPGKGHTVYSGAWNVFNTAVPSISQDTQRVIKQAISL